MGIVGIAPPGAERAFVAEPGRGAGRHLAGLEGGRSPSIRCSRSGRRCAKAGSWRCARSCWWRSRSTRPTRPGSSATCCIRIACRQRPIPGRDEPSARRLVIPALAGALVARVAARHGRGQRAAALRRSGRSAAREARPAGRRGSTRRDRRDDPVHGAPAARAARRARRRRPRRGGSGAAGRLPQPAGRLGPARRRRRRGARRRARRAPRSRERRLLRLAARRVRRRAARGASRLLHRRGFRTRRASTACCSPASPSRHSPAP